MEFKNVSSGKNPPEEINVFVEISKGSSTKYEVDEESGFLMVDRFLYTSMVFPFNYGFVPNTKAKDGDPLDVVIISSFSVNPGAIIPVRPVGMLQMEDEAGIDHKIIAVPAEKIDPEQKNINDIDDVNEHIKDKIKNFFNNYKALEPNKWVKTKDFLGKKEAQEEIKKSLTK